MDDESGKSTDEDNVTIRKCTKCKHAQTETQVVNTISTKIQRRILQATAI